MALDEITADDVAIPVQAIVTLSLLKTSWQLRKVQENGVGKRDGESIASAWRPVFLHWV